MSKFSSPLFILTSLLLAMPGMAEQGLYKKISPACVEILVGGRLDGSGAIVCSSGLVLTACHVTPSSTIRQKTAEPDRHLPGKRPGPSPFTQERYSLPRSAFGQIHPYRRKTGFSPWFSHFPPSPSLERNHSQKKRILFLVQRWVHQYHTDQRNRSPWFIRRSLGKSKR